MNFLGMGPWMMGVLAKQYNVASPKELLEAAQALGVEFIPCQMTMDMFGLKREDMIDGHGRAGRRRHGHRADDRGRRPPLHLDRERTPPHDSRPSPTPPAVTRTIDARGSFCPGPLMELIRGHPRGARSAT